jgi:predicted Zn-dependent protease
VSNIVDFSSVLVILSYGRDAEFEADKLGADFEYRARYNPLGGVNFFVTLKDIEGSKGERASLVDLLATHPPTADRIDRSKDEANELLAKAKEGGKNLEVERAAYLKRMDGMVLGDSLDAGFVKDDKYSNKKYMFVLRKPSDWKIITARSYLAGLYRDKNNFFLTYAKVLEPDQSLTEYARQFLKEAFDDKDFEPQFKSTTYRDMSALDFYVKRSREVRALFFARNKVNYALVYSYVGQPFVDQDEVFNTLSKTFDFMTKEEADKILEDKLRIYTAVAKDTSESISVKFYQSPSYKDRLMEYNGLIPPIVIGTMFKIPPAKYLDEDKEEK